MKNDDGNEYILLNRTFNPAGVVNTDSRENVLISIFDEKPKDNKEEAY